MAAKNLIAFGWYGGKYSHLSYLLPLLPPSNTFIDVYGGSASVVMNYQKAKHYVYNDIDKDLVNFFQTLRDEPNELIQYLELTPISREYYYFSIPCDDESNVVRAAQFFTKVRQTHMRLAQSARLGRWCRCTTISRCGMVANAAIWQNSIKKLGAVARGLKDIEITNEDALASIERHDGKGNLIYLDPPYVHDTRTDKKVYGNEMSDTEHEKLIRKVLYAKSLVAISGYDSPLYDSLIPKKGWCRHSFGERTTHSSKAQRTEVLWTNYDINTGERL